MTQITRFGSKIERLTELARGRQVLHLGAVGETQVPTESRVAKAPDSVHAKLTAAASRCVGVDYDEPSVTALTERGIFDNLICMDVTKLTRDDIPLDHIDVVVVGDTIEHLSNPGDLLDAMTSFIDQETRVVITTPNALGLMIFVNHLRGRRVEGVDHVCSFNQYSLTNLLTRHGWRAETVETCYQDLATVLNSGPAFRAGKALFKRKPLLGGTLLAVCSRISDHASGRAGVDDGDLLVSPGE